MQEFIEKFFESLDDQSGAYNQTYTNGETPEWETIDNVNDLLVAIAQKLMCGNCSDCYWHRHCANGYVKKESERVLSETKKNSEKPKKRIDTIVTCGVCVYATSTKPKICMCPDGIAKHAYVEDDCYCDKGELCTT